MVTFTEIDQAIQDGYVVATKRLRVDYRRRVSGLSDCWIVTSHYWNYDGRYPRVMYNGKYVDMHRLVKFIEGYDLAPDLTASHLCETLEDYDSYGCINPEHIVLESKAANQRRSPKKQAQLRYGLWRMHKEKVQKTDPS